MPNAPAAEPPVTNEDLALMIKQGFDRTATKDDVAWIERKLDHNAQVLAQVPTTVKEHTSQLVAIHASLETALPKYERRDVAFAKKLKLDLAKIDAKA